MKDIIYSLPDQILESIELAKDLRPKKRKFNRVIVCGMGGSGISGEILAALYPDLEIIVNKDYEIPQYIKKRKKESLAILISYSGNTEETLNNYNTFFKRSQPMAIISSDGKLLKKEALLKIKIPQGLPPRGALGYLFTPLPFILYKCGIIKDNPEQEINSLANFLNKERDNLEKEGERLSEKFINKLPIIYANSFAFGVAANRWRAQFNENAKILCHTNIIPEMNHNEIVGLGRPESLNPDLVMVFLNDPLAHKRNKIRVQIIKEIIKKQISDIIEINPPGKNPSQRLFWTIMLGDFISYYLAVKTNIEPMPVARIDYLKKRLSEFK